MKQVTIPVFPILGLIFVTLKLTGHIAWPWLWVLAPFWAPFAVLAVFLLGLLLVLGVGAAIAAFSR